MKLRGNPAWHYFKFMSRFAPPPPRSLEAEFKRLSRQRECELLNATPSKPLTVRAKRAASRSSGRSK